jgi:hypothetical protein
MKHKHADLIHAWADGAQIQCKQYGYEDRWADVGYPNWENPYCEYRIKPEPKPDIVKERCVASWTGISTNLCPNLRLTFDGETGELKSAEVL